MPIALKTMGLANQQDVIGAQVGEWKTGSYPLKWPMPPRSRHASEGKISKFPKLLGRSESSPKVCGAVLNLWFDHGAVFAADVAPAVGKRRIVRNGKLRGEFLIQVHAEPRPIAHVEIAVLEFRRPGNTSRSAWLKSRAS